MLVQLIMKRLLDTIEFQATSVENARTIVDLLKGIIE